MARKVIGPTGSRRRRWLFLCTSFAAIALAVLIIPSAFAVHDENVFQLDGNALKSLDSTPGMPSFPTGEDADNVCAGHKGATDGTNPAGEKCNIPSTGSFSTATSSTRSAFVTDGSGNFPSGANEDVYTSGSKDGSDVSTWAYKKAGSSNDKSDIENAFAAFYTSGTGHKLVYFGGDRTSNSGDENTAFWFLQSPAFEPTPDCSSISGAGCPFTNDGKPLAANKSNAATHVAANAGLDKCLANPTDPTKNINIVTGGTGCTETDSTPDSYGDILVVSAFTGGGVEPNITAYEWFGPNNYATGKNADKSLCGTSSCTTVKILDVTQGCSPNTPSGDAGCAVTNQNVQNGGVCPPSGSCTIGQNPSPTASPWVYLEKTSDNTNSGANACQTAPNKFCPGTYFEGGIDLTSLGLQSECTSTFVMDTRSSQSVDSSLQDLAVGQVGSCTVTLTTKAGDTATTGGVASPTSIGTGSVNSGTDTATLTVQGANSWAGTLTWFLCGPLTPPGGTVPQCDRTKGVAEGSTHVTGTDENPHSYVSPGSANLTSAGTYCWTAHFAPDAGQNSQIVAKDDTGAQECFTVNPVSPTLTTCSGTYDNAGVCTPGTAVNLGTAIHDSAKLSNLATEPGSNGASHGGNANYPSINATDLSYAGRITFTLKGPSASGCGSTTSGGTGTNPQSLDVNSTTGNGVYGPVSYTPGTPGVYHWQATIDNVSPYMSPHNTLPQSENNANCTDTNEDVTVNQHPTTTVTSPVDGSGASLTTAIKGTTSVFDKAVVTDSDGAGSPPPTGSVSFWICNPSQTDKTDPNHPVCADGTGTPLTGNPRSLTTGTPSANQSQATSSPAVVPDTVGVWCFRATYTPDTTAFTGSSDNSNDECFNVVDVSMTTAQTFTLTDSATITPAGPGATIGGTVAFTLFTSSNCAAGTSVFSQTENVPDQGSAYTANASTVYTATSSKPTLSWLVVYTPDATATQKTVTKACNSENASVTINNG